MRLTVFILISCVRLWAMSCGFPDLDPPSPTARYLALVTRLSVESRRLPIDVVEEIAASENPVNPLAAESYGMREGEAMGFRVSFSRILREPGLDWARVRDGARRVVDASRVGATNRARTSEETAPILKLKVLRTAMLPSDSETRLARMAVDENGIFILSHLSGLSTELARLRGDVLTEIPVGEIVSIPRLVPANDGKLYLLGFNDAEHFRVVDPVSGATVREFSRDASKPMQDLHRRGGYPLVTTRAENSGERIFDVNYVMPGTPFGPKADGRGHYLVQFADGNMRLWDTALGHSIFETAFPNAAAKAFVRESVPGKPVIVVDLGDGVRLYDVASGKQNEWRENVKESELGLVDGPKNSPIAYLIKGGYATLFDYRYRMRLLGEPGDLPVGGGLATGNLMPFRTPHGHAYFLTRKHPRASEFSIVDVRSRTEEKFVSPLGAIVSIATLPDGRVVALTKDGQHLGLIQLYGPR